MLVWIFFTALLQKLGWGMGQRWAGSASGSYPVSKALLSFSHFLMVAFRQDAHLGEKDTDAGLSPCCTCPFLFLFSSVLLGIEHSCCFKRTLAVLVIRL